MTYSTSFYPVRTVLPVSVLTPLPFPYLSCLPSDHFSCLLSRQKFSFTTSQTPSTSTTTTGLSGRSLGPSLVKSMDTDTSVTDLCSRCISTVIISYVHRLSTYVLLPSDASPLLILVITLFGPSCGVVRPLFQTRPFFCLLSIKGSSYRSRTTDVPIPLIPSLYSRIEGPDVESHCRKSLSRPSRPHSPLLLSSFASRSCLQTDSIPVQWVSLSVASFTFTPVPTSPVQCTRLVCSERTQSTPSPPKNCDE